jgi:hypothetical protein
MAQEKIMHLIPESVRKQLRDEFLAEMNVEELKEVVKQRENAGSGQEEDVIKKWAENGKAVKSE